MSKLLNLAHRLWNKVELFNDGTPEERKTILEIAERDLRTIQDERFKNDLDEYTQDEYKTLITQINESLERKLQI